MAPDRACGASGEPIPRDWSIGLAIVFCLSIAFPASAQHEHHAAPTAEASASTPALYTPDDLQFLQHMIVHHGQAIAMGALVPERTERDALKRFARYVAGSQAAEIAMMQGMLNTAAARGLPAPEHEHGLHLDPPMAGMLSSGEMAALEAATGEEFERLWLTGMIFHHEGGLAMARVQQLQQLLNRRRPHGLEVMVEDIVEVQRSEVATMRDRLSEWGLVETADLRAPAVETAIPAPGAAVPAGAETTLFGVAVDDIDIAAVRIGIQDLAAETWLRSDGSWGAQELQAATLVRSGPSGAAWGFAFTPPTAGRYAVTAEAEDTDGKRAASPEPRELVAE